MAWLTTSAATDATNTPFMRRCFSATMIAGTMTATDTIITGSQTIHWSCTVTPSVPRNRPGTTRKLAVSMACSAKMPKSSRSNSPLRSTAPIIPGTVSASRCTRTRRGVGTTNWVMAMPTSASPTISQKMPATPMKRATIGPAMIATMKEAPIEMPTVAMALVRCSSRVRSATSARITEPTAPEPCSARPMMTPPIEVDIAATALPSANSSSPNTIITLRPTRSDNSPNGICSRPWLRP